MATLIITVPDAMIPALQSLATKANLPTPTAWLTNYATGSAQIEQRTLDADNDVKVLERMTAFERATTLARARP